VTKLAITFFLEKPATLTLSSNRHLVVSQLCFSKAKKKEHFICIQIIIITSTVHYLIMGKNNFFSPEIKSIADKNWENISFLTTLSYIHVWSC